MNKLKNTIVLRGMSSNVVEEAIVILKPNVKLKQSEYVVCEKGNYRQNYNNKTIRNEAENVIKIYVEKINEKINNKKIEKIVKKYKILKVVSSLLMIVNMVLIIKIF